MINIYAYTYPSAIKEFSSQGIILVKVGDSTRNVDIRMAEQGGAAEWQGKVKIASWNDVKNIKRDHDIHRVLRIKGHDYRDGSGTEWFKIPSATIQEAYTYIDKIIADLEGGKIRDKVKLRITQERSLNQAMEIIERCTANEQDAASIIANLCPRFGKTIWALMLFNRISKKYGNRIMLLPAYWLSSHTSFVKELDEYDDFLDICEIDINQPDAAIVAQEYLSDGRRIVIPISLHGDLSEWSEKHKWLTMYNLNDIFMFADEGDFGTHTENQAAKLQFLFKR